MSRRRRDANEPHEPPARNRQGDPCGNCTRLKRKCHLHGGRSTGPRTPEGKRRSRENALAHGLRQDPVLFRERLTDADRAELTALVDRICEEESVTKELDRLLVLDFVTAEAVMQLGRESLKEDAVKVAKDGTIVLNPALAYMRTWASIKQRVHERLRAGTGERGDAGAAAGGLLERLRDARRAQLGDAEGAGD